MEVTATSSVHVHMDIHASPVGPSSAMPTRPSSPVQDSSNKESIVMQQYQDWLVRMMMILEHETWSTQQRQHIDKRTKSSSIPEMGVLPSQSEEDQGKMTVVLDIDETLIHTMFLPDSVTLTPELAKTINEQYNSSMPSRAKHVFCFALRGRGVVVRKRPFLDDFLQEASQKYELIAFTAGVEDYASLILDHLDPQGNIFRHRLFRQHCSHSGMVKDLRVLNRDLSRTVLVDNSHSSFLFQLCNGIPIESFVDDMSDQALRTLGDLLENIHRTNCDVRHILGNIFRLEARLKADFQAMIQLMSVTRNQMSSPPSVTRPTSSPPQ